MSALARADEMIAALALGAVAPVGRDGARRKLISSAIKMAAPTVLNTILRDGRDAASSG